MSVQYPGHSGLAPDLNLSLTLFCPSVSDSESLMLTVMARLSTLLEIDLDPYQQKLQYSGYFSMVLCFHFLLHQNYSNCHQYHLLLLCYQCLHYPVQILQFLVFSSVLPLHYFPFENYSHHHHCHLIILTLIVFTLLFILLSFLILSSCSPSPLSSLS